MKFHQEIEFTPDGVDQEEFDFTAKLDINGFRQVMEFHVAGGMESIDLLNDGSRAGLRALKELVDKALALSDEANSARKGFEPTPPGNPSSARKG